MYRAMSTSLINTCRICIVEAKSIPKYVKQLKNSLRRKFSDNFNFLNVFEIFLKNLKKQKLFFLKRNFLIFRLLTGEDHLTDFDSEGKRGISFFVLSNL